MVFENEITDNPFARVRSKSLMNKDSQPTIQEVKREPVDIQQKSLNNILSTSMNKDLQPIPVKNDVNESSTLSEQHLESQVQKSIDNLDEFVKKIKESLRFDVMENPMKYVIFIYGKKGSGKTTLASAFPGNTLILSFDSKSFTGNRVVKEGRTIAVDIVSKYDTSSDESKLESASRLYIQILNLLTLASQYSIDWIVFDSFETLSQICEMKMRCEEGLKPYEGIRNLNLWKKRNDYIYNLYRKAMEVAKKGVIFTSHFTLEQVITDGGEISKEVPAWSQNIMRETDVVIRTDSVFINNKPHFRVTVETSKMVEIFPIASFDVTSDLVYDEKAKQHLVKLNLPFKL